MSEHGASENGAIEGRVLVDPYLDWLNQEGIPVVEDFCIDLNAVATKPWQRLGADGAAVHMLGRGDFISMFILDLPPGGKTEQQRHIYEEVFYVLSGHGTCVVEDTTGRSHSFEWGPKSLFALPLNAPYRLFNGSGRERARIVSTNNACMMLKALRNERFIFDNPFAFDEREAKAGYFAGEGSVVPNHGGRTAWETNFIPDLASFKLNSWNARGAGSANMVFIMAEGTMHAHMSEMGVGTYKKAHRHGPDFHVCIVTGRGYSLFWHEGEDFKRYDWHEGCVFAPTNMIWHQHFNTGGEPVRYLATAYGSSRYPFSDEKRRIKLGVDVSVKKGGAQIEYSDQDPRVHRMFLDELKKNGVKCRMGEFLDERMLLGERV
ncbi:MAG TPA: cupin domain-containing protein [Alphaproteobacteria bacterium]|jgi:mannose-6-phosphate isomerase-like protein (cupin superfamily)|nr:cupin domain-containing protein [Alphaproteobacteria bacterium]